jgi:putative hydrolase of the HAD superfamily
MYKKKNFLFDLDDTLYPNHYYYLLPQIKFVEYVCKKKGIIQQELEIIDFLKSYVVKNGFNSIHNLNFLAQQEFREQSKFFTGIYEKQENIDVLNVAVYGFSMKRFPTSFRQALAHFQKEFGFECTEADYITIENIAKEAFNIMPGLIEGAGQTLDFLLEQGDELFLVTKGDAELQQRKIEISGLGKWFARENTYIVEDKTNDVIKNIVNENNLDKNRTYAVGNSAGSDITPAILNGLFAIYIPVSTWKYEREKPLPESDRIFVFENGITEIQKNYQRLKTL